uniref:NADH-ubiquinone oxidoreductase chain 5 n=1 Tax=Janus sp. 1 GYN-2022e TaxID=3003421 RepID=A0A9E8Z1D7_9HYME|nr:NADH dehydrogenase subunit 5 [Janus sp. 1 GYN-2022e]
MMSLYLSFFFFFISVVLFNFSMYFMVNKIEFFLEWCIISINSVDFCMLFLVDWMSFLFMSLVFFISSMIMLYSHDYMKGEIFFKRFILLVLMFVMSMLLMIMSPSLLSILLGWDGLGLTSYCLVAFYQNIKAYNAAMLTVLMNRFGDTGLMMSLSMIYYLGSWNLFLYEKVDFMVIMFFCLAAMTKSAQIPFSSWLPAAMSAPTPVSSLVHSSTLVTAGVYMLIRYNHLMMESGINELILILSLLTMFMSGLSANWEFDLKKIIALSTLSQLGLMMSILSLGGKDMAFFHLLTHAMFKALLFMCGGVIIHSLKNFQDIRYMGAMVNLMPYTLFCFNLANMALMGLPFLSGFYSKDLILEEVLFNGESSLVYILFLLSIGLTISYSVRMFMYSVFMEKKMISVFILFDSNFFMNFSMFFMSFMSIFMGKLLFMYLSLNFNFIMLPKFLKFMILYFMGVGVFLGYLVFNLNLMSFYFILGVKYFLNKMWFLFEIFNFPLKQFFLLSQEISLMEKNWVEGYPLKSIQKMFFFMKKIDFIYVNSFKLGLYVFFCYICISMFFC